MLDFIGKWKDKITDYVDTRVQVVKLEFIERTSNILGFFIFIIGCIFLISPILLFMGMGLAEWFAGLVDSRAGGYLIVAGIYLLLLLILYAGRKSFIASFAGIFVSIMTKNDDDDDEEEKDGDK